MSYLTRELIEKILPKNSHLDRKARKIAGIAPNYDKLPLEACLVWLADVVERDRTGRERPGWAVRPDAVWYPIVMYGLQYWPSKWVRSPTEDYDKKEGWCICIAESWPERITAEYPTLVAMRAVVVMHCWREWRNIFPADRPEFIAQIREFMAQ